MVDYLLKLELTSHKDMIIATSLIEIGPLVLQKKIFFGRRIAPLFDKLESPPSKDALCHVWLKLAQWFWRNRLLTIFNINVLFRFYLPLEKCVALHLNKFECPLPKDTLCLVWFKLVYWFWRRTI